MSFHIRTTSYFGKGPKKVESTPKELEQINLRCDRPDQVDVFGLYRRKAQHLRGGQTVQIDFGYHDIAARITRDHGHQNANWSADNDNNIFVRIQRGAAYIVTGSRNRFDPGCAIKPQLRGQNLHIGAANSAKREKMNLQVKQIDQPAVSPVVDFWNDILAPKIVTFQHIMVAVGRRHSNQIMQSHGVRSGDQVFDVGCGFDDTTVDLANRIAPNRMALGVDCCQTFLDHAWHRAELGWIANAQFKCCDIETTRPVGQFDFVFAVLARNFLQIRWLDCDLCGIVCAPVVTWRKWYGEIARTILG